MRRWVWVAAGIVGIGLTLGIGLKTLAPMPVPPYPAGPSVIYPPRTLPEQTRLILMDKGHSPVWQSGETLNPTTLEDAAYLSFKLPSGLTYTYATTKTPPKSLPGLEVQVGNHKLTLGLLVRNRGYTLSANGELLRKIP